MTVNIWIFTPKVVAQLVANKTVEDLLMAEGVADQTMVFREINKWIH